MSRLKAEDSFEQNWRQAFDGAEIAPPRSVWDHIDLKIVKAEAARLRRKALIYQWAAIIAILVAVTVSIPFDLNIRKDALGESFVNNTGQEKIQTPSAVAMIDQEDQKNGSQTPRVLALAQNTDSDDHGLESSVADRPQPRLLLWATRKGDITPGNSALPTDYQIQPVPVFSELLMPTRSGSNDKRYWAGVGAGSASFDPNYSLNQSNEVASALLSAQPNFVNTGSNGSAVTTLSEEIGDGVHHQIGLNMGMKVADRWTIEGGMQYAQAQVTSTTNVVIENRFFTRSVALNSEVAANDEVKSIAKNKKLVEYIEEDVVMNNDFQFAAVPLKAGYILVDDRFNLKINAGLLTSFYLGNTLTDPDDDLATVEIAPGENSPYRMVSFSGLAGVSVGYRVFGNIDLLVEPNYLHAIQPLTKESSNFVTSPTGLGVTAGVRFHFK